MKNNQLIPGEPLREGVDLIADKKTGALIVVGNSSKLENIIYQNVLNRIKK